MCDQNNDASKNERTSNVFLRYKHLHLFFEWQQQKRLQKYLDVFGSRNKNTKHFVKVELLVGAYKSNAKKRNVEVVTRFLKPFEIVPFTDEMTEAYADIRSTLEANGNSIGLNDILIVTIARSRKGVLITHNAKEFSRVKNLEIEYWTK